MRAESIEKIIEYLEKQGIKAKNEQREDGNYNRTIEFEVENVTYYIEWWVNQSYFKLQNEFSAPYLPFKYIGINPYSPTTRHKYQLCFYDIPNKDDKFSEIPFGCMKLPFNCA